MSYCLFVIIKASCISSTAWQSCSGCTSLSLISECCLNSITILESSWKCLTSPSSSKNSITPKYIDLIVTNSQSSILLIKIDSSSKRSHHMICISVIAGLSGKSSIRAESGQSKRRIRRQLGEKERLSRWNGAASSTSIESIWSFARASASIVSSDTARIGIAERFTVEAVPKNNQQCYSYKFKH